MQEMREGRVRQVCNVFEYALGRINVLDAEDDVDFLKENFRKNIVITVEGNEELLFFIEGGNLYRYLNLNDFDGEVESVGINNEGKIYTFSKKGKVYKLNRTLEPKRIELLKQIFQKLN